jgi:hypothetical protein
LGILYNLVACFASDLILGPAWAMTVASTINAIGLIMLVVWNIPEAAKWFAFSTMYWSNALSSVFHGWVNTLLRDSPEERSFTLVLITIIAQSSTAWTPLLTFPTVEAPSYPKGFSFCLGCALALIASTHVLNQYIKRKEYAYPSYPSRVLMLMPILSGQRKRLEQGMRRKREEILQCRMKKLRMIPILARTRVQRCMRQLLVRRKVDGFEILIERSSGCSITLKVVYLGYI